MSTGIMAALFNSALANVPPGTPATPTPPGSSSTLEGNTGASANVPVNGQGNPPPTGGPNSGTPKGGTTNETPVSPLDKFSKLWEANPADKAGETPPSIGSIDPQKIMEMAGQMDFTKMIPADAMAKISAGGEQASAALSEVVKSVGASSFAQSIMVAAKLTEKALQQQNEAFQKQLPTLVKQAQLRDGLITENPVFNHPATKPLVDALQVQFAQKYPDATAAELKSLAQEFVVSFAGDLTKGGKDTTQETKGSEGKKETDWSTFLPDFIR